MLLLALKAICCSFGDLCLVSLSLILMCKARFEPIEDFFGDLLFSFMF